MELSTNLSKVYNCDCLEYMKSIPDNYFDLAIADPPYGIGASKPSKKPSNILQKNGSIMSASVTDFGKKDWDNNIPSQEYFEKGCLRFDTIVFLQDAKQAIHDRITNSWQRSFTLDQVGALNRYHQKITPDAPAGEVFEKLLHEVAQEPDVARQPEKWITDTAKELDDLAEGITRDQSRGVHIK